MSVSSGPRGVLLLSHRGFSFMEDLIEVVRARGLEIYILSSKPANPQRITDLKSIADWVSVTDTIDLTAANVSAALEELAAEGKQVAACLTVWEGARRFMAEANARAGVVDISPEAVDLVQDKYAFRMHMVEKGLSRVDVQIITPETLAAAQRSGERKFVKPRHGVASFGAFSLTDQLTWGKLQEMRRALSADPDYAAVLSRTSEFLLEDYIPGREYSFEVIASSGELFLIGVHEKVDLEDGDGTTLEAACISPPIDFTDADLEGAREYIWACLKACDLHSGAYHIEARQSEKNWEIIEINPRIGGAFINASLKAQGEDNCLLRLSLATLLAQEPPARDKLLEDLRRRYSETPMKQADCRVFFRVYFGEPGMRVTRVAQVPTEPSVTLFKALVADGTELPNVSREVFVAQALWTVDITESPEKLEALKVVSRQAVNIEYEGFK